MQRPSLRESNGTRRLKNYSIFIIESTLHLKHRLIMLPCKKRSPEMFIENTIKIRAPHSIVWDITTDVEQWPSWTPTVTSVHLVDEGPLKLGSAARIKQPGQPEAEWTVTEYEAGKSFVWESRRIGLKFRASHNIEEDEAFSISILKVEASGFLSVILWPLLKIAIGRSLKEENKGLKQRCEALG